MNEQASAWLTAIEGLPQVHPRLSRVVILCDSAFKVIPREDSFNTLFYLDPPYFPDSRTSPDAYGLHELTREQHIELLQLVRRVAGKVMISGYDCPLYADYLDDWRKETWTLPNNAAGGKEKRKMTECLWCNWTAPA
jgi:DNA adenine methylase